MTFVRQTIPVALSLALCSLAYGQEQTDPYAELGLIEDDAAVEEEVAPPDAAAPVAAEPQRPLTEEDVLREHARFLSLLEEQNYDAADIAAKRVIEMSIKIYGPQSHETAKALINLAVVQNANQQYEAAIQNFSSAVEIIEILEDRLNSQLVNPLKGLGTAQLGAGRPDLAAKTYARATHITHVNEGPHNIEQVEILESLAEANVRLGDVDAARDVLDRIHILNVRHFSDDALGLLPSLMRRASWQHRAGYYNDERATYRRAIRIIEDSVGKDDPRLVDPLIKLGKSFYYFEPLSSTSPQYFSGASGETYLKRAKRIAERDDEFPWLELATTKLALADFYIYSEAYSRAKNIYEEVWDELSTDEERMGIRAELMAQPQPIWTETLPPATNGVTGPNRQDGEIQTGVVTVTFDVTTRGRARIEETRVDPPEFTDMARVVEREVRRRIYRPAIVDGDTRESGPQVFTHEFQYSRSEWEEMREQETEQTAANQQ
jgi:tetratricopeptide (TPR) repeat protein